MKEYDVRHRSVEVSSIFGRLQNMKYRGSPLLFSFNTNSVATSMFLSKTTLCFVLYQVISARVIIPAMKHLKENKPAAKIVRTHNTVLSTALDTEEILHIV